VLAQNSHECGTRMLANSAAFPTPTPTQPNLLDDSRAHAARDTAGRGAACFVDHRLADLDGHGSDRERHERSVAADLIKVLERAGSARAMRGKPSVVRLG